MSAHRPKTKAKIKFRPDKPPKPEDTTVVQLPDQPHALAHKPTVALRKQVETMAGYGVPQPSIASLIGIHPSTLRIHYRLELDLGAAKANMQVAATLFQKAVAGDGPSCMFWLKTRAGWRETNRLEVVRPDQQPELINEGMDLAQAAAAYEATLKFPFALTLEATEEPAPEDAE